MSIPIGAILESLKVADEAFELGGKLVEFMQQRHPVLNETPVPDAGAEMDRERADAVRREQASAIRNAFPLQDDPDAQEDPEE